MKKGMGRLVPASTIRQLIGIWTKVWSEENESRNQNRL